MRYALSWLFLMGLLSAGPAIGQGDGVEEGREMIRQARIELVRSELRFTDEEAAEFWPMYERYRAEVDEIQDRYTALIAEYIRRYDDATLSNDYADELIARFFGIKRELLSAQERYVPEFRKILPALKVARLMQLETKISADIDAQIAITVPLIEVD